MTGADAFLPAEDVFLVPAVLLRLPEPLLLPALLPFDAEAFWEAVFWLFAAELLFVWPLRAFVFLAALVLLVLFLLPLPELAAVLDFFCVAFFRIGSDAIYSPQIYIKL